MHVRQSSSEKIFQIFLNVLFITIVILSLIPLLNVISTSFSSKDAIMAGKVTLFPVGFNTDAYAKVFSNESFMGSFMYSVIMVSIHTALAMVLTILAAYPLAKRDLPGRSVLMGLFVVTMYFDPGIIPHYLNIKDLGMLNTIWCLIIPGALSAYNLVILRNFFAGIDNTLFEAAKIDGCSEMKILTHIAVPLAKPAIATLSLFYAVNRWNGVSDVMYYISDSKLMTVQVRLKQFMDALTISQEENLNMALQIVPENVKCASIIFSMVPMLIAYPFIQKYFAQGVMVGAVKG